MPVDDFDAAQCRSRWSVITCVIVESRWCINSDINYGSVATLLQEQITCALQLLMAE